MPTKAAAADLVAPIGPIVMQAEERQPIEAATAITTLTVKPLMNRTEAVAADLVPLETALSRVRGALLMAIPG